MGDGQKQRDSAGYYCHKFAISNRGMGLKRAISISLLGHMAVFGAVGFSFGNRLSLPSYSEIFFWGTQFDVQQKQILPFEPAQSKDSAVSKDAVRLPPLFFDRTLLEASVHAAALEKVAPALSANFVKIISGPPIFSGKSSYAKKVLSASFPVPLRNASLFFHPLLPYSFSLYFRDRQVAHVELMFKIEEAGARNTIVLRRKISSGDLEVDLLTMRYISHYLFIKQNALSTGNWQTVKIDLSAQE